MTSTHHGQYTSELPTRGATPALQICPPRHPNTGDYRPDQRDQSGKSSVDPITLGFEKLNARFDNLDRRLDNLARQPFNQEPRQTRRRDNWDPPWTRRTTAYQRSSSYELDMYSPSPPKRRPTCWDPPVYRETPRQRPFNEVSVYDQPLGHVPNSRRNQPYTARDTAAPLYTFPRRYSVRGPASRQPRSAIIAEEPINAELDHLLEVWDRKEIHVDATDDRVSKFRSLSQPDEPVVSSSHRTLEYPPSRNTMASRGQSGLYPNVSLAPPRHSTTESINLRPDFQPPQGNPSIQRRPLVFQQSDQPATRQPSCLESPLTTAEQHVELDHAELEHVELDHAELEHAELEHAELEHAELEHAELEATTAEQHDAALPEPSSTTQCVNDRSEELIVPKVIASFPVVKCNPNLLLRIVGARKEIMLTPVCA